MLKRRGVVWIILDQSEVFTEVIKSFKVILCRSEYSSAGRRVKENAYSANGQRIN